MKFRTEKLILEGPDLTGKTSLYQSIHKATNFHWNIQDRSALSMVCYARQYGRDATDLRRDLYKELTNLNNRLVILMPPVEVILQRFHQRGDDVQNEKSLKELYDIFADEVEKICRLPNVCLIRSVLSQEEITESVLSWLKSIESCSSETVGKHVRLFVECADGDEHVLQLETSGEIQDKYDTSIMSNPLEEHYYKKIERDFCNIIEKEFDGINDYNVPQGFDSRRFYYSSNSCMSSLHLKPRGDVLEFICAFRSTDAQKNAGIDFQFLEYLVHKMANEYFLDCSVYRIMLTMNSAHLRHDN